MGSLGWILIVTPDCFVKPFQVHTLILTLDWLTLIADSKFCRVILLVLSMSKFTDWSRNGLHGILLDVQHLLSLAYSLARKRILSSYKVSSTQLNNKNVLHNVWRFNHESQIISGFAAVESKLDKEAKIIVACSTGGLMKPSQNLPEGNQSR